ncbi:uncharacterized protein MYCGRDRAFT_111799 [Zymoseptoria tritici IPO323]|uniref:Uncharacterized protein n=1 Tax=Zymoseptoria tritici (strain CBS 115943 / IPO323) TaxID=336722 RepID=F9XS51_ZYMTI|nr:uncharacterized protein MYCGRDRAFT_111799 [Zymoseptoria tritici IPO323]EGP81938.1 hypothetical protein MYCGRDRAFT_111799 [Zymoseptoria tritici IPO323]
MHLAGSPVTRTRSKRVGRISLFRKRQNVPGMDAEKGSKVGSDRKVRDSMIVREERLGRDGDVDDCSDAEDSVGEDCGGEEDDIGGDINGDINDDDDINVIEGSRQTQSEVAQLHRNQLDMVTRFEATIQQRCDEGKADLQTWLEQQHALAITELCVEQQHLRASMQHLQDEHTRLQSVQAAELSTLRAEQDGLSDFVCRLRADATLHLDPAPNPDSSNTVPRLGLEEKQQLEVKTELEEPEEDASTTVLLGDILTTGLGRAMELVVQIGQRQHSVEEEKGSVMKETRCRTTRFDCGVH